MRVLPRIEYLFAIAVFVCASVFSTSAATFTVTKTDDTNDGVCDGDCSLREAIATANSVTSDDSVIFDPSVFFAPRNVLASLGAFQIENNGTLNIVGPGIPILTLSAAPALPTRLFIVRPSATLMISAAFIANGRASTGAGFLVEANGTLSISNATLSNNNADLSGGAVFASVGSVVSIMNSTIQLSRAVVSGGVVFVNGGNVQISNSTVAFSQAGSTGAAVFCDEQGTVKITTSIIRDGTSPQGAAIHNNGNLTLDSSFLFSNSASGTGGGGVLFNQGSALLTNSTINGNTAPSGPGGGVRNVEGGILLANHITVNNNTALKGGGVSVDGGNFQTRNSIFADNAAGAEGSPDIYGSINSLGYNLIENSAGTTIGGTTTGNILGVDPKLMPFGNNGGPTPSCALMIDSPAIDGGDPENLLTVDQRGLPRPSDGDADGTARSDIGSFERQVNSLVVTKTTDTNDGVCDADCSLREAITAANASPSNELIRFDSSTFSTEQTITLTSTGFSITNSGSLQIAGPGSTLLTINGNNTFRIFNISAAQANNGAVLQLSNLTLANGFCDCEGGAIYNGQTAVLSNLIVRNSRGLPGAVANAGNTLTIRDTTVTNSIGVSVVNGNGSLTVSKSNINNGTSIGISNQGGGGVVTVEETTISNNVTTIGGAGIRNVEGTVNVTDSVVRDNAVSGSNTDGGGIFNFSASQSFPAILTITNSTITGNSVTGPGSEGGGIGSVGGRVTIIRSSIVNNNTQESGGGIYNFSNTIDVRNSTISGNTAFKNGGGIYNRSQGSLTNVTIVKNRADNDNNGAGTGGGVFNESGNLFNARNTIIADNTAFLSPDYNGPFSSLGNNLIENIAGATISGTTLGNILGQDPRIDPVLRANGGPTQTHALMANSPAIDAGDDCVYVDQSQSGCLTTRLEFDQRGKPRKEDGNLNGNANVDIGSFEAQFVEASGAPDLPDLVPSADNGVSNSDNVTSIRDLSFILNDLNSGATVELYRDGELIGSSIVSGNSAIFNDNARPSDVVNVYSARQIIDGSVTLHSAGLSVTVDNTAPAVSTAQAVGQADPTRNQPISFTLSFNEPIVGFNVSDISLAGSTAGVGLAQINVSGGPLTYTVSVGNLTSDGTVSLSMSAGMVTDLVGLGNSQSTATDNSVTLDTTAPTVTINQAPTQGDPTATLPVNFTVTFSEPVTGFTSTDVSLTGSTANTGGASRVVTGSGSTYNVAISNFTSNGGFVMARVSGSAANDAAGNSSVASTSSDNTVVVDNIRPSVTINQGVNQLDPTSHQPVRFAAVFNEPVSGFTATDVSLAGSTANVSNAQMEVSGSGSTYFVDVSGIESVGQVVASIPSGSAQDSLGNISFASTSTDNSVAIVKKANFDFDADGKSDISVWRPSDGIWYIIQSGSSSVRAQGWGLNGDKLAPADFDGDGKTDLAVFRESDSNWYIFNSSTNTASVAGWGLAGDLPVPADYGGDGKADLAVYRPSEGKWYRRDSDGKLHIYEWGLPGDKPAPADFNGDGVADMTVFRPSEGKWYTINSGNAAISEFTWGLNGDLPVPGDYSGDGKSDFAVFRPSNQTWYRIHSDTFQIHIITWGLPGDFPTPGDYDGDGRQDLAVFRPSNSTWFINSSTGGIYSQPFGLSGDIPVENAFVY